MNMVCFDQHYVKFDTIVIDPVHGDKLQRYIVFNEEGEEKGRFVLPVREGITRWEIQNAAKDALKVARRRKNMPKRMGKAA